MKKNVKKVEAKKAVKKAIKKELIKKPVEKKVEKKIVKEKPSISRLVFSFITNKKVLESENKKAFFLELQKDVLKVFPKSAFKESHFYWYISKYKLQKKYNLELTHLQTTKLNKLLGK